MRSIRPTLIIIYRELLRFWRSRLRIISSLMMPFIWLVMFGSGISSSLRFSVGGPGTDFNYILFLFPGVLAVNIIFTSLYSAITMVRDREFGFLKEVLVAPIPRASIALGKIFGGAIVASLQGFLMVILLPVVGIPLSLKLFGLLPFIFVFAVMLSALAVMISARIVSAEGFQMVMSFLTFPMFMLSGALFPLRNLPGWMEFLSKINPASYGVDLIRRVVFYIYQVPDIVTNSFGIVVFNRVLSIFADLNILLILSVIMIVISANAFAKEDA